MGSVFAGLFAFFQRLSNIFDVDVANDLPRDRKFGLYQASFAGSR
jgi:hypothetical protein